MENFQTVEFLFEMGLFVCYFRKKGEFAFSISNFEFAAIDFVGVIDLKRARSIS